jgi:hypothetical protein
MFSFFRRLRARLKYRHFERDLAQELDTHRAMAEDDLQHRGLSPDEAKPAAARALGNTTYMREEARAVWFARWLEQLWQDVRYAGRGFRRQPGFATALIAILGLSTGLLSTAVVYTDATLLQLWRVPDPGTLRLIRPAGISSDGLGSMRVPEFEAVGPSTTQWAGLALAGRGGASAVDFGNSAVARVPTLGVTAGYFEVLGLQMAAEQFKRLL